MNVLPLGNSLGFIPSCIRMRSGFFRAEISFVCLHLVREIKLELQDSGLLVLFFIAVYEIIVPFKF